MNSVLDTMPASSISLMSTPPSTRSLGKAGGGMGASDPGRFPFRYQASQAPLSTPLRAEAAYPRIRAFFR